MAWRVSVFILVLLAGAALGGLVAGKWGAELGVIAAAITWFVADLLRGLRVLRWVRRADDLQPPQMMGLWGEIVERTRRALRVRELRTLSAENRLQEFLAAIQASPNGVLLLDDRGRIEWCNQTAADHFGLDPQRDLRQLVGNLLRDPVLTAHFQRGDDSQEVVVSGRGATALRPRRISVRLHPYGEGRKLMLSRDITALEQAESMRRDFVANVSHEIRTPLTVLSGFVETLRTLPLEEADQARYLGLMAQQAQRMQALVDDLLTLSRLEGSALPATDWTPAATLLSQCEQEAMGLSDALRKAQSLAFDITPGLEFSGATAELLSAMSNLVSNAIRYTPAGGRVAVSWRALPDGRATFSVSDTGPGIAAEHIPRLTERFYRLDRSRSRETGGTGLGLAIVKHVVQRHGGELSITSTPGEGSCFAFSLPAARVRLAPGAASAAAAQPTTAAP